MWWKAEGASAHVVCAVYMYMVLARNRDKCTPSNNLTV